jgi:hypothetical protein
VQRFEAMVQAWEAGRPIPEARHPHRRAHFSAPPRRVPTGSRQADHMKTERQREAMPSLRLSVFMCNPAATARAPPRRHSAPAPARTPPASPPRGAERMYAAPTP